jgi:tetratricopeptide (TPR) repeat protein
MLDGKRVFRLARQLSSQSVGWRPVLFICLLLLCGPCGGAPLNCRPYVIAKANSAKKIAPQSGEAKPLTLGVPIESNLAGGETHAYQVTLSAGQYLHTVVDQRGIDVVVKVFAPDGKQIIEVDSPNGSQGPEPVFLVAEAQGSYRLEVASLEKGAQPGQYEIRIEELRAATPQDRSLIAAQNAYAEGERLRLQRTAQSLRRAIEKYQEALSHWRTVGDRGGEAKTLTDLGSVYNSLGEMQKALDVYNQALPLSRAVGDLAGEATTFSGLCFVYGNLGEMQKALDSCNQSLLLNRAVGDRSGEAVTLGNTGWVYGNLGEMQKALDSYNQALPLNRAAGNRSGEAVTLGNIGMVYRSLGEIRMALDYYNQSLSLSRAVGDRLREAAALNNIGEMYSSQGEMQKALDYHNQSLALSRAIGYRAGEAVTLNNIGRAYYSLGEAQKALDYYNQALLLHQAIGMRSGEAVTLSNIGQVYRSQGEMQKALDYYNRALLLHQAVGDRQGEAVTLNGIAHVERNRGNLNEARLKIEEALKLVESIRAGVVSKDLRASYFASAQDHYDFYIDLLMRLRQQDPSQGYESAALLAAERARARSLLELLAEAQADIRQGVDPDLLSRERSLRQRINAKAEIALQLKSNKQTEQRAAALDKEIDALMTDFQQVQAEIRQKSPRYATLTQPQPLDLAKIQAQALDSETLLLEYALGDERSYLWAVTPDSITSYRLPPRAEIEAAAWKVYELLTARQPRVGETNLQLLARVKAAEAEYPTQASALSRLLLGPAASQLGRKRLLIVAPGALEYLPFGALPAPAINNQTTGREQQTPSHDQPLMAEHEIVSLPSASALSVIRGEIAGRQLAANTVAVLADPVFELDDQRVTAHSQGGAPSAGGQLQQQASPSRSLPSEIERAVRSMRPNAQTVLPRLPFTRDEADAILAVAAGGARLKALDFQANRATAMSDELSRYRIIHFATHGLLNSEHPELSGLVFSLIDEQGRPQNGFLRLYEIYNLRLPAELVVLSACQSGLGKQIKGEGLVGLTRGFMYAGAPRVVASLWQVNDLATAELMKRFYRGMLKDGLRPAAALRAAQIEMFNQKQWSSPYFWAAFVIQGEWK